MSLLSCPFFFQFLGLNISAEQEVFQYKANPAVPAQNDLHAHSHDVSKGNVQNQSGDLTQQ